MKRPKILSLIAAILILLGSFACVLPLARAAALRVAGNVDEARVRTEAASGNDWMLNGQDFGERHFSPLKQITGKNVSKLGLAWSLDIDSAMGMAAEPIEVDGVIYVSAPRSLVYAVDAVSGKVLWKFDPQVKMSFGTQNSYAVRVNRGVAVWEGKVYVSTGDCRLVAIDAASGKQLWSSQICDPVQTGSTGAPHIARGKVLIGYNGSDDMVRGSLVAFDASSGHEAWRFWTVPGDPSKGFESKALEEAAKTWSGDRWWRFGGGDAWDAITYDPQTNLVIFGTAGSGQVEGTTPPGAAPRGAKLFAGCVVAINPDTGQYVWHFQTSGDHFQTENFHTIVTDLVLEGRRQHVAITAPRNGFIYVLDAASGHLLEAKPYGATRWASAIDLKTGRPVESVGFAAGPGPERGAGKTWWPMSYNPITGLVYIPAYDLRTHQSPGETALDGRLVAWDPIAQSVRWSVEQPLQTNGGVLSTAGNLVFQGEGTGEFAAYAADTGRKLWSVQTGSAIDSVPVSFRVKGEQYIVIPVGWGSASRLFQPARMMATPKSKRGPARLLAFKLGATTVFPTPPDVVPAVPRPPARIGTAAVIEQGERLFESHVCGGCHGPGLDGSGAWTVDGAVPDLRYAPAEVHQQWDAIVLGGSHREQGMMAFGVAQQYPDISALTGEQASAIHAYVIDQSWKAYDEQNKSGR
jgi:quinohemoprotein ethanol dehydrogenase